MLDLYARVQSWNESNKGWVFKLYTLECPILDEIDGHDLIKDIFLYSEQWNGTTIVWNFGEIIVDLLEIFDSFMVELLTELPSRIKFK